MMSADDPQCFGALDPRAGDRRSAHAGAVRLKAPVGEAARLWSPPCRRSLGRSVRRSDVSYAVLDLAQALKALDGSARDRSRTGNP